MSVWIPELLSSTSSRTSIIIAILYFVFCILAVEQMLNRSTNYGKVEFVLHNVLYSGIRLHVIGLNEMCLDSALK